jgi:IS605 OrfB family transposase
MKLTAQIKLIPTPTQADALRRTLEAANAACDAISRATWEARTFRQFDMHRLCYQDIRAAYGLSAQVTVRAIAKVADSYKLDKKTLHTFAPLGALAYDARILSFKADSVSIWTVDGRAAIPFVCGERARAMLQNQKGESDLVYRRGEWFLYVTCEVEAAPPKETTDVLGIDLGIVNIATDSDGETFSGARIETRRQWYANRRAALQKVGTKSAKRHLRKLAGKQRRFQTDTNHVLSKRLVAKAEHTKRGMALEDLTHIRSRARARGPQQRARHSNWAFGQLRAFLSYKAERAGIAVVLIDPRNTSRTCSVCGHCEKANRRSQALFCCVSCGHTSNADLNAAMNIKWAAVNQPLVSDPTVRAEAQALRL